MNKFRSGDYVFVREVSNKSLNMNGRWTRERMYGKEGHRIKVTFTTRIAGEPAVHASQFYWHESDLLSVEENRELAKANKVTLSEKDILSIL